jgi:glycosyltransferase involved in cell wall biosynthesis
LEACSIIVPAFNGQRFLAETLEHICKQTFRAWELIVVDDGSSDGTSEIGSHYSALDSRVRMIRQPNAGLSRARNFGFRSSNPAYDYVLFIDADDLLVSDALEHLIGALRHKVESPACHGAAAYIDERSNAMRDIFPARRRRPTIHSIHNAPRDLAEVEPTMLGTLLIGNCITSAGQVLIRRRTLSSVGGFDPLISAVADWDMWYRIAQKCGPILYVPSVVLRYRIHAGSMSAKYSLMKSQTAKFLLKRRRHAIGQNEVRMLDAGQRYLARQIHGQVTERLVGAIKVGQWTRSSAIGIEWLYTALKAAAPPVWFQYLAIATTGARAWISSLTRSWERR